MSEPRLYPDWSHEYEIVQWVRRRVCGGGGVFIDVGANVGVWSIGLAGCFDKVYAVEPFFADQLRMNLRDYGVGNVEVIEAAAWDFDGQVLIGFNRVDNDSVAGRLPVPRVGLPGRVVKSVRLDGVIREPFRLLKIDVEGEAMHVLYGMRGLISSSRGIAVIEVHNHGESHGSFLFMRDYGWSLEATMNERMGKDWYHAHKVYIKK